MLVPSHDPLRDAGQWLGHEAAGVEFVLAPPFPRLFGKRCGASQRFPILQRLPQPRPILPRWRLADIRRSDVLLSTGGDNYSLDYGLASLYFYAAIADAALAMGKPSLL